MGWIDAEETPPPEGATIDVWQAWYTSSTGTARGRRLTNAWVHSGRVLHGDPTVTVKFYTHWMHVPKSPSEEKL